MTFANVGKCGARTRSGASCRQPAMRTNRRCKMHGGRTPVGLTNPNLKTGRYSKVAPLGMAGRYQTALSDPELLSVRDDIALLQARIDEKLAEMAQAQETVDYTAIVEVAEQISENWKIWSRDRIDARLKELVDLSKRTRVDALVFDEIRALLREKGRMIVQENKRMVDLGQMMTVEQGIILAQSLAEVSNREITDEAFERYGAKEIKRRILNGIRELVSRTSVTSRG